MRRSPSGQALGQAIRQLRHERGLTQEELCDRAEISVQYLSNVERGVSNPTWKVVVAVAAGLGLSPSELAMRAEAIDIDPPRDNPARLTNPASRRKS